MSVVGEMLKEQDTHEDGIVHTARRVEGGWEILWDRDDDQNHNGGLGLVITDERLGERAEQEPPESGARIRVYPAGFGRFHGVDINGVEMFYLTPSQRAAEHERWVEGYERRLHERFEAERERLDAEYEALPAPLKARIDRFRSEEEDFRWRTESYEMAAVNDAPKIASAIAREHGWTLDENFKASDVERDDVTAAATAFHKLPWDEQRRLVPDLNEGHSGNTFGGACRLSVGLLLGEAL